MGLGYLHGNANQCQLPFCQVDEGQGGSGDGWLEVCWGLREKGAEKLPEEKQHAWGMGRALPVCPLCSSAVRPRQGLRCGQLMVNFLDCCGLVWYEIRIPSHKGKFEIWPAKMVTLLTSFTQSQSHSCSPQEERTPMSPVFGKSKQRG